MRADGVSRHWLLALNVAKSLHDLSPLRSVGLHKLRGDRKDQWAMTVNARWTAARCCDIRRSRWAAS